MSSPTLPKVDIKSLILGNETVESPEIEALYEQFKCLAATEYLSDPLHLNGAISRQTFDKCFVPNTHVRPPPPNLIYDRMFAFYDTDSNGLIGFEEFVRGLSALNNKHRNTEKLRRIFKGYDLDNDGYVDRRDFLRMFRAFYALSKDLVKDMVASMDDDMLEANQASNVLIGSQPISAAFAGSIPVGSRREGKGGADWDGDEDSDADIAAVILPSGDDRITTDIASGLTRRHSDSAAFTLPEVTPRGARESEDDQTFEDWIASNEDFNSASSTAVAATMPSLRPSNTSSTSSTSSPHASTTSGRADPQSLSTQRRREFFDSASDNGDEGVSGLSDQDVGSEILYQITQQGLNELLELLFAAKEEMAIEARREKEGEEEGKGEREEAREIRERGGEGRLSFEEFEGIMRGRRGRELGFVGSWIDMASF